MGPAFCQKRDIQASSVDWLGSPEHYGKRERKIPQMHQVGEDGCGEVSLRSRPEQILFSIYQRVLSQAPGF